MNETLWREAIKNVTVGRERIFSTVETAWLPGLKVDQLVRIWMEEFPGEIASKQLAFLYVANELLLNCVAKGKPTLRVQLEESLPEAFRRSLASSDSEVAKLRKLVDTWTNQNLLSQDCLKALNGLFQSRKRKRGEGDPPPVSLYFDLNTASRIVGALGTDMESLNTKARNLRQAAAAVEEINLDEIAVAVVNNRTREPFDPQQVEQFESYQQLLGETRMQLEAVTGVLVRVQEEVMKPLERLQTHVRDRTSYLTQFLSQLAAIDAAIPHTAAHAAAMSFCREWGVEPTPPTLDSLVRSRPEENNLATILDSFAAKTYGFQRQQGEHLLQQDSFFPSSPVQGESDMLEAYADERRILHAG